MSAISSSLPPTTGPGSERIQSAQQADVYLLAFATIDSLIQITNSLGLETFNRLKQQGNLATEAKAQANAVQSQIGNLESGKSTELSPEVITWMRDNKVPVTTGNGTMEIDSYLATLVVAPSTTPKLDAAALNDVKNSLDNFSQKALDTVNTVNLQIQQVTQKLSYLISLLSNLLSARYDQAKGVVQNIR